MALAIFPQPAVGDAGQSIQFVPNAASGMGVNGGVTGSSSSIDAQGNFTASDITQNSTVSGQPEPVGGNQKSLETSAKAKNFGILPMEFEENRGQADPDVRFISHGKGYTLFLTASEAVVVLNQRNEGKDARVGRSPLRRRTMTGSKTTSVVRMKILGGNPVPQSIGTSPLAGTVNYFTGRDAHNWHTGISTYSAVHYSEVYPGTDLVYYGKDRQLEYDFVLNPGADPGKIALSFEGTKGLAIDGTGNVTMGTEAGKLILLKPTIYQIIGGQKMSVHGRYVLRANQIVGLELGRYDSNKALVVDPVLSYSTYLGGSADEFAESVVADGQGNVYIAGATTSVDFPHAGSPIANSGHCVGFVMKLDSTGTTALYSVYFGGSAGDSGCFSGDYAWSAAVDSGGQAYVVGPTVSQDFPVTTNAFQSSLFAGASSSAFLLKLSQDGGSLLYSTYLGGENNDGADGIAVDSGENAYVGGWSTSAHFPVTSNAFQTVLLSNVDSGGWGNGFISRIDTTKSGPSSLVYSSYLGGSNPSGDAVMDVAVDSNHNAYLTGFTSAADFPVTASTAFQASASIQNWCGFVSRIDTSQSGPSSLLYSSYLCGTFSDWGVRIVLDQQSNAYVGGVAASMDFPTNVGEPNSQFGKAFAAKLNTGLSGSASLVYSTLLGGNNSLGPTLAVGNAPNAIAVDSNGNAYIVGLTLCSDFPTTSDAIQTTLKSSSGNGFLTALGPDGSSVLYSTYFGGSGTRLGGDQVGGVALDPDSNIYIVGQTDSDDLPTTSGAFQLSLDGSTDAFAAKFTALSVPRILSMSPSAGGPGTLVTITGSNFGDATGAVQISGTEASVQSWSAESILVQVPSLLSAGSTTLLVKTSMESSNPMHFLVEELSITSLSSTSGAVGTPITLTGTGFGQSQGTSSVSVNGATASPSTWSDTSIIVTVPLAASLGTAAVVVNVFGTASNAMPFAIVTLPTIIGSPCTRTELQWLEQFNRYGELRLWSSDNQDGELFWPPSSNSRGRESNHKSSCEHTGGDQR